MAEEGQGDGGSAGEAAAEAAATAEAIANAKTVLAAGEPEATEAEATETEATEAIETEAEATETEATGAPEAYADFTLPEGMQVNEAAATEFKEIAKGFDLTQEQAQKLVDFETKRAAETKAGNLEAFNQKRVTWLADSKADKEIGGQKFDGSVESAKRGLAEFGTKELIGVLELYGLGNHPEIIRAFARVGEAIGDDTITTGKKGEAPKSRAERIFTSSG